MIQQDTIQVLNDSAKAIPDTIAKIHSFIRVDSLERVDSIKAIADSLKAIAQIPTGHVGIPHPSFPQTESWVFIILLILFFLLVYAVYNSGGMIGETLKTFFQVKERSSIFSKATVNNIRVRLLLIIFSIGVLSLYVYLIIFKSATPFSIKTYCYFFVLTAFFFGLKSLIFDLIGYVFLPPLSIKMAKESYFNILTILGTALFPILIFLIYIPYNLYQIAESVSLFICIGACILVIIKLFQIFFHKIVASFYILLYLCTLEILPLIVLYRVYKLIM